MEEEMDTSCLCLCVHVVFSLWTENLSQSVPALTHHNEISASHCVCVQSNLLFPACLGRMQIKREFVNGTFGRDTEINKSSSAFGLTETPRVLYLRVVKDTVSLSCNLKGHYVVLEKKYKLSKFYYLQYYWVINTKQYFL